MVHSIKNRLKLEKLAVRITLGGIILLSAYILDLNNQVPFNEKDKSTWTEYALVQAANENNMSAQFLLASAYMNGLFNEKNPQKGQEWMKRSADNKHGLACILYAQMVEERSPVEAEKYYRLALEQNELDAAPKLATLYIRGAPNYPARPEEALKLLHVTSQLGHPPSMALLANIIYDEKSHKNANAARWLQKAIELEPDNRTREEWSKKLDLWIAKFTVPENTEYVNATLEDLNKTLQSKADDKTVKELLSRIKK